VLKSNKNQRTYLGISDEEHSEEGAKSLNEQLKS